MSGSVGVYFNGNVLQVALASTGAGESISNARKLTALARSCAIAHRALAAADEEGVYTSDLVNVGSAVELLLGMVEVLHGGDDAALQVGP
jgi:hypothetical protein